MTKRSNIRAIGSEDAQDAVVANVTEDAESVLSLDEELVEEWEYEEPARRSFGWIAPTLALLSVLGWTGFYGWAYQSDILAGGTPQQWAGWITSWSVPVLLVTSIWLLAMRNSKREAERFGIVANTLSQESALLEQRLITVNRELSLAREFLGSQARELDSVGRMASERLTEHAGQLRSLVISNGEQIDAIADVSMTAMENMGKLRDDLPVIANSARDVSNQIGTAGRTAHGQVAELVSGFDRLNQFGKASEAQVGSIQTKVEAVLTAFEAQTTAMEQLAEERFGVLRKTSETFRADLDSREVEVLSALRRRAEALEDEFTSARNSLEQEEEEALLSLRARLSSLRDEAGIVSNSVQQAEDKALNGWQNQIAQLKQQLTDAIEEIQRIDEQALASANSKLEALRSEAEAVDANIADRDSKLMEQITARQTLMAENEEALLHDLTNRFEKLDSEITARREAQLAASETLAQQSEAIAERIGGLRGTFEELSAIGRVTHVAMTEQAEELAAHLLQGKETMAANEAAVSELTESSVRLLELIQASARHSKVDLPEALGVAEARLIEVRQETEGLRDIVGEASQRTEQLSQYVIKAQATGRESIDDVDALRDRVSSSNAETHEMLMLLKNDLGQLSEQTDLLSAKAHLQLREAISALENAAKDAPATIENGLASKVEAIAARIGAKTTEVLDRTLENSTNTSLARIEECTTKASAAGRETIVHLRDQLGKVNELAANLENRVAHARERAEEQVGNDFARRMALITESLNSNAIDIAKVMSTDVSDTAWVSYLRGDRGIFTRRAVRLLDNTEARDIAEIYDADPDFRENVSRYIHDFEAMLRSMLSTRDGNALSVTLLSSDMGKLYVALAQSIERLRE